MEPREYTQHDYEQLQGTIVSVVDLGKRLDLVFDPKPIYDLVDGLRAEVAEQRSLVSRLEARLKIAEEREPAPLTAAKIPPHPHREFERIEERLAALSENLLNLTMQVGTDVGELVALGDSLSAAQAEMGIRIDELSAALAQVRGQVTAQEAAAARRQSETQSTMQGIEARRLALGNGVVKIFDREPFKALKAEVQALQDLVALHATMFATVSHDHPVPPPPPVPAALAQAGELAAGLAALRTEVTKQQGDRLKLESRVETALQEAKAVLEAAQAESQRVFEREPFKALSDQVAYLGSTIATYSDLHAEKNHKHPELAVIPIDQAAIGGHIHQYITRGSDGVLRCACGAAKPGKS